MDDKKTIDFAAERRKRQRQRRWRNIGGLLVVALIIFAILYVNDVLVRKSVTVQIGDLVDASGGDGYPARLPSGTVRNIDHVGRNLAVLKDSNLYVYNHKGKQIENLQQMGERTVLDTNADRLLYFDVGGRELHLHSGSSMLHKISLNDNIITATLGNNGEIAVVTWPPNFVAEIQVFRSQADEAFYTRSLPDNLVTNVAVSPKGRELAAATLGSDEGMLDTNILLYPLDSQSEPTILPLPGRLVVTMEYLEEEVVAVLTDRDYQVFDTVGRQIGQFSFPSYFEMTDFRTYQGTLVLMGMDTSTRETLLYLVSDKGEELGEMQFEKRPHDVDVSGRAVYILTSDHVVEYDYQMKKKADYPVSGVERIYTLSDRVYLLTKDEIQVLDKKAVEAE